MATSETAAGSRSRLDDTTARQLLESQSETSLDGVLVVSQDGRILSFNRRFAELWCIPDDVLATGSDEAALQFVLDQLPDPETFLARVAHLYANPEEQSRDEIVLKDGRVLERSSGPVTGTDGRSQGRVWFFRDVSRQRAAEAELELRVSELDALARMAQSLVRAESLDDVVEQALDTLTSLLGLERAAVLLTDDGGVMRFRAWRGLTDGYRALAEGHSPWPPDAVDPEPVVVDDVELEPELEELRSAIVGEGIRSLAFVPLVHGRRLLGKFMLYAPDPAAFGPREVRVATTAASQIAAAAARMEAEHDLRASRDQLAVIVREIADGITVQDATGNVVFANDAAARQIGFDSVDELLATPRDEVMARFELLDEDRRPLALERLPGRRALAGESHEQVVCYRIRATGEERWSSVRATPVRAEDGRVQFAINVFHDISERKRAEERVAFLAEASTLLASSLDYRATLARIAELAVPELADWAVVDTLEPDGSLRRLGAAHAEPEKAPVLYDVAPPRGYRRIVAEGRPLLLRTIDDAALDAVARDPDHLRQMRELGACALICVPLVSRGRTLGAITLASTRASRPYGDEELRLAQELASRAALAVDNALLYGESEAAARRLAESFALLDALLASAPVGIGFWDRNLRYVRVNETLAELNGVPAEAHVGRTLHDVIPGLAPELEPVYRRVLETGEALEHQESTRGDPTVRGEERHWLSSCYPVKSEDGETIGVGAVITEITERRRAERERAARARQQATVAALGQLALADAPLEELFEAAVTRVAETLGVEYAKVLELLPDEEALKLVAGVGWSDGLVGRATVSAGDSQAGFTLRSAEPVVVDDLRAETRFSGPPLLHEHGVVSGLSVAIEGSDGPFGVLGAHTRSERRFTGDDVNFLRSVANVLAAATERRRAAREREELLEAEQQARRAAEHSAEMLTRLQAVTEATLVHLRLEDLLSELLARVTDLLSTDTAAVLLLEEEQGELVAWAAKGLEEEVERGIRIPLGRGFAGRVAAERRPLAIDDVDHAEVLNPLLREKGIKSLLGVPLRVEDRVVGVLHVGTLVHRRFTGEDRTLLQLVGDRVALAIEQSRLYERERSARGAAEAAERRVRFLAEASRLLSSSLDYEATLRNVADVAGTSIADWVSIYLLDEDERGITRILGRHRDPERNELAQRLAERWPPRLEHDSPASLALLERRSFLIPEIGDEMLVRAAQDEEHLEALRSLGLSSAVVVPFAIGDRTLGSITFVREQGRPSYTEEDLALAEELGRRVALAVENARLYEAARYQSQLVRTIADNAASALFMMDERGHPTYMNRTAELMTGYRLDEIEGAPLHVAVHHTRPDGTPYPIEECPIDRALLQQHRVEPYEDVFVRKDGTLFPVRAAASPIVSAGRPVGTVVEVRDITDEKRADSERQELLAREQQARREAEARAQAAQALEFVADGVLLVDREGVVRLWNPAAATITGVPADAVLGRRADEAIAGWSGLQERIPAVRAGAAPARPETLPLDLDGRELWLSISAVEFDAGTVFAFRDVTEERGVEKLKSDFVSTVSHELRTPLAAIYGAALTLRRDDLPLAGDQQETLLGVIADEAERLARIVNDILWTSRIESGGLQIMIESCDPIALAQSVIEAARVHAPGNVVVELSGEAPPVAADPDKVRMVLANLVDNAVKYSPDGGTVRVDVGLHENRVRFSVRDEGLGIPGSEQQRVFEKFYRLDPNLTRGIGGTGLGLYICRELVRRMDGRIWVESTPGRGSTFTVELPAAR